MVAACSEHLARLAEEMRPYETGATYVNFLELGDGPRSEYRPPTRRRTGSAWSELKDRYDPDNLFRFNRNIPASSGAP